MKNLFLILFLFQVIVCFGQELGKTYVLKSNYKAKKCNGVGDLTSGEEILERGFLITIDAKTSSNVVVSLPAFDDTTYDAKFVKSASTDIYFLIAINDFKGICDLSVSKHSFTVGIPTIPVKLRFGNGGKGSDPRYFRFEGNISLGLSGGYKYSFGEDNEYAFNAVVGFTTASVQVDSLTTKGRVNASTSAASFSPHLGAVLDVKKFQFGIYTGVDFLYGEPNKYWVYRNQPWIGIGVGLNLFTVGGSGKNSTE